MTNNRHIIKEQVFEIVFNNREKTYDLQNRISALFYNQALNITEEVFSRFVPGNMTLNLETLVIDIGSIELQNMESDFGPAYKERLEEEIAQRIQTSYHQPPAITGDSTPPGSSAAALLEYFLFHGQLPWWAGGLDQGDPTLLVEALIRQNPGKLKKILLRLSGSEKVRQRLIFQFPVIVLKAIIELLEPAEAAFIFAYHEGIVGLQQEKQVVKTGSREFANAVWFFILTYLLVDRGSNFNKKEFMGNTISQMARHFNSSYRQLIALLKNALDIKKTGLLLPASEMPGIILALYHELKNEEAPVFFPKKPQAEKLTHRAKQFNQELELIKYYLLFGSLPAGSGECDEIKLATILSTFITTTPSSIKNLFLSGAVKPHLPARIKQLKDEQLVNNILELLIPPGEKLVAVYVKKMIWLQEKKNLFKTGNENFREGLQQDLFFYCLSLGGKQFEPKDFLRENLRQWANRYGIRYPDLLTFIIQGLGESINDPEAAMLFDQVKSLLPNARLNTISKTLLPALIEGESTTGFPFGDPAVPLLSPVFIEEKITGPNVNYQYRKLKDLLQHLLVFGSYPWWYHPTTKVPPASVWKILLEKAPQEVMLLLKFAGLERNRKQRVVDWLPLNLLKDSFRIFAGGKEAVTTYETIESLLIENHFLKVRATAIPRHLLLSAFWNQYDANNYSGFDTRAFIENCLLLLSGWTGIAVEVMVSLFIKALKEDDKAGNLETFRQHFVATSNRILAMQPTARSSIFVNPENIPAVQLLASNYFSPGKEQTKEESLPDSLKLLTYYLLHNQFPPGLQMAGPAFTAILLKELMELLFQEKPMQVEELFSGKDTVPDARIYIEDLFLHDTAVANTGLRKMLEAYRGEDINNYLVQVAGRSFTGKSNEIRQLIDFMMTMKDQDKKKALLRKVFHSHTLSFFVASECSDELVFSMVSGSHSHWGFQPVSFLKECQQLLLPAFTDSLEREKFRALFREFLLYQLLGPGSPMDPPNFLTNFIRFIAEKDLLKKQGLLLRFTFILSKLNATGSPLVYPYKPALQQQAAQLVNVQQKKEDMQKLLRSRDRMALQTVDDKTFHKEYEASSRKAKTISEAEKIPVMEIPQQTVNPLEEQDGSIYINNAGLVLVHPFLSTLFQKLQWLEKGKFINESFQFRAVHLLQYLVDGTEQNPEFDLVLNKILCGISLETTIPREIFLNENEKQLAGELLKAVLATWEKLQNTSVNGLQVSFLQRKGILSSGTDSWKLRVEQKGIDVLLAFLPWGLGLVKSSWMKKFLLVEWT